jgi:hypothetical protein
VTDEELALAIMAQVDDDTPSAYFIETFFRAGEWAQAGIRTFCDLNRAGAPIDRRLLREALDRWEDEMGGYLFDEWTRLLQEPAAA